MFKTVSLTTYSLHVRPIYILGANQFKEHLTGQHFAQLYNPLQASFVYNSRLRNFHRWIDCTRCSTDEVKFGESMQLQRPCMLYLELIMPTLPDCEKQLTMSRLGAS